MHMADATVGATGAGDLVDGHQFGMIALRGYLVLGAILLIVKAVELARG